ncbi:MAG: sulfite exporter TauE/SafE family protein [Alphaproteobacteria bacterium]|nr:sulfite exporter TauE/SafE family protein [Alphaproteobacteria bacterium]
MAALSSYSLVFYAAVLLGAFMVRSAAGFGAGLIAIPMLALILPVSTAVSVASVLTVLSSTQQVSREWRQIAWRHFIMIFLYSMVGVALGLYFVKLLNEDLMRPALGIFMILYSLRALFSAGNSARPVSARWHAPLGAGVGIVGGLCSALFGAGAGPIYIVYFDILRLEKAVFRATMSAVVLLSGGARIVGYGSLGLYTGSSIALLAIGIPLMIAGSWVGDRVVYRLNARSFARLVSAVMLLSGATLLIR